MNEAMASGADECLAGLQMMEPHSRKKGAPGQSRVGFIPGHSTRIR